MILKDYFAELAWRHKDLGHTKSNEHFCDIGDESQVHADVILQYPCVLYGEDDGEEFIGYTGSLRRPYSIAMLFLDHVIDTSNFDVLQDVYDHMNTIAEDFIRKMWEDHSDIINDTSIRISKVENKDAALYGVMITFAAEMPFCMKIENSPFLDGTVWDKTFDNTFG